MNIAPPGNTAIHQLKVEDLTAWSSICPQEGASTTPKPRKLRVASDRMAPLLVAEQD